mgnify:FL=1
MNDDEQWRHDNQKLINIVFTLVIAFLLYQNYKLSDEMDYSLNVYDVENIVEKCKPKGEISYSKELEYGKIEC